MSSSLYSQITDWSNLLLAFRQAARGKRSKGAAAGFEHQLADRLLQLQRELVERSYQPGGYVHFLIHDPKRRLVSAAPFRDRVVHHALCNVIEPLFERQFIADSYANRVGLGTHRAVARLQSFARRYRYVFAQRETRAISSERWRGKHHQRFLACQPPGSLKSLPAIFLQLRPVVRIKRLHCLTGKTHQH